MTINSFGAAPYRSMPQAKPKNPMMPATSHFGATRPSSSGFIVPGEEAKAALQQGKKDEQYKASWYRANAGFNVSAAAQARNSRLNSAQKAELAKGLSHLIKANNELERN